MSLSYLNLSHSHTAWGVLIYRWLLPVCSIVGHIVIGVPHLSCPHWYQLRKGNLCFSGRCPHFYLSIVISLWTASSLALEVLALLDTFRAAVIRRARTRPPCGGNTLQLWHLPWVLWHNSQAQAVSLLFITEMSPFKPAIRSVQVRADSPVA